MSILNFKGVKIIKEFHESTGMFVFSFRGPKVWILSTNECPLAIRKDYISKLKYRLQGQTTGQPTEHEKNMIRSEIEQTELEIEDF